MTSFVQPGPGRAPTMADIADHLGISRPLVSIVLRDAPGASDATRERVLAAAAALGYTPHQGARNLRQRQARHLGVTLDPTHASEPEIVESIYAAAADHGYQVMLSAQTADRDHAATVEELLSYRCAGLIHLTSPLRGARLTALVERAAVPSVVVGPGRRSAAYDRVHAAGGIGIGLAVDHLVELGHRDVAYVHCPALPSGAERLAGLRRAARRHGLDPLVVEVVGADYTEEAGSAAARTLLEGDALPTAVVAGNDQQALGVLWVLARAGVRIPADVSVTGFDDTRFARLSAVDLTTATQDTAAIGRAAVDAVVRRIEHPGAGPEMVTVAPRLVVRSSTGPPRRRVSPRRTGPR